MRLFPYSKTVHAHKHTGDVCSGLWMMCLTWPEFPLPACSSESSREHRTCCRDALQIPKHTETPTHTRLCPMKSAEMTCLVWSCTETSWCCCVIFWPTFLLMVSYGTYSYAEYCIMRLTELAHKHLSARSDVWWQMIGYVPKTAPTSLSVLVLA